LSRVNWSELEGFNDTNQSYKAFDYEFTKIYNTCFPVKHIKRKHHFSSKPWLSKRILKSIKRKKSYIDVTYVTLHLKTIRITKDTRTN
jgi:hypothetical protein